MAKRRARTADSLLTEADAIKHEIEAGSFRGKKLQAARYRYYGLRYRAKKRIQEEANEVKKTSKRKSKAKSISKDQSILPSFLTQMSTVRIEELVAEKIFAEMKKQLESENKEILVSVKNKIA